MFTSLMYFSKVSPGCTAGDIACIFKDAHENNKRIGMTGILYSDGKWFIQVLEGARHEVSELFHHIQNDKRHFSVVLVSVREIDERQFSDWAMGIIRNDLAVSEIIKETLGVDELIPPYLSFEQLNQLLMRLADTRLREIIPLFRVTSEKTKTQDCFE